MTLARIRALAEAATLGPWFLDDLWVRGKHRSVCKITGNLRGSSDEATEVIANAAYIAAAHPALVLALIAEVGAARAVIGEEKCVLSFVEKSNAHDAARAATDAVLEEMK